MREWIKEEIVQSIENACNFGFIGEPKDIAKTANAWFDCFENTCKDWTPERDGGRILKAFSDFFITGKRFPLPANIIELLPPRKPQAALPRPEITDDERITARQYLALCRFQCSNADFRAAYGVALKNKLEHENSLAIAHRVLDANQDLKDAAITFFKNYNEDLIKRFD